MAPKAPPKAPRPPRRTQPVKAPAPKRWWADAASFAGRRYSDLAPYLLAGMVVAVSLGLDLLGSFKLEDRSEAAAAEAAGMVTGPIYGGAERVGQREITLVLFDAASMKNLGQTDWPVSYDVTAQLVDTLAAARPKAIFLDFYYTGVHRLDSGFPDREGLAALVRRIEKTRQSGVPVLIGPVAADADLAALGRTDQAGLTLKDERAFAYPLVDTEGRPMAARRLYDIWARGEPDAKPVAALDKRTLALDWGFGASNWMAARVASSDRPHDCRGGHFHQRVGTLAAMTWRALIPQVLSRNGEDVLYWPCPYFDTLSASAVLQSNTDLTKPIYDRIVLVGVDLDYLADRTQTPLLGRAPGVTAHAMALDNLMEYGPAAPRYPLNAFLGWDFGDVAEMGLIAFGIALALGLRRWRNLAIHQPLSLRDQLTVWLTVAVTGVTLAILWHWPTFKLVGSAVVGGVALAIVERFREEKEGRTPGPSVRRGGKKV